MKKYDSYKPSGIEWLGDIPNKWKIFKLKFLTEKIVDGTHFTPTYTHEGIPFLRVTDLNNKTINLENTKYISKEEHKKLIKRCNPSKGDLLLSKNGTIGLTKVIDWDFEFSIFVSLCLIKVKDIILSRFLEFQIKSIVFFRQLEEGGKTTSVTNLHLEMIKEMNVLLPPKDEQEAIADFLDKKCEAIDNYILKQQEIIKLLKEKKSSLINKAVTKGLDPKVECKDSEIEWLGKIPKHWETIKIKRLCLVKRGASPRPIDDPRFFDDNGEYSWVRIADVSKSDKFLYETTQKMSKLGSSKSVKLEPNKIFLSIAGSVGKPIISKIKCCIHDGFVWFDRLRETIDINFLYYIFLNGEAYKGLGKLGTQLNLNTDTVGMIDIPMISLPEQKQIVEYIEKESSKIDKTISHIEDEIKLLNEYKQSLISSAVTGKIKVI